MPTDWKAVARGLGIDIADAELERELAPLAALERVSAETHRALKPEDDLAVRFVAEQK